MVNEDLIGGIEIALSRGKNLKDIMVSYYNSGYKKQEIEEAAMVAQQRKSQPQITQAQQKPVEKKGTQEKPKQKTESQSKQPQQKIQQSKPQQKVSDYKSKIPKKPRGKFLFVLLIIFLILIGAVAISYFFFKEEVESILFGLVRSLI